MIEEDATRGGNQGNDGDGPGGVEADFTRFEGYLRTLTELWIDPRLRSRLEPSDVVQAVLLKAFKARGQLRARNDAGVAAWLRQILRNTLSTALSDLRREERHLGVKLSLDELAESSSTAMDRYVPESRDTPPPGRLDREEALLRLLRALDRLPPPHREVMILQRWHRWTVAEIAKHTHRTESAVAGLLRRALETLREELKDLR
ncbi:MAG: sigma-70 family RNA polymerase sigma factor [Planctomycetes bacterium]|nr:sigma-70 family RNA polymerase sigma factor [Planctomycetota bacterium]